MLKLPKGLTLSLLTLFYQKNKKQGNDKITNKGPQQKCILKKKKKKKPDQIKTAKTMLHCNSNLL